MKKNICRALLAAFIFLLSLSPLAFADNKDDIQVKLDTGFDGIYKYGYYVPFNVEIQNSKADIDGELQLGLANQGSNLTVYSTVVNIPKGSTKKYTMNIPISNSSNINIKLMNGKEVVYDDTIYPPTGSSQDTYLIGILSDDFDSVNYFKSSKQINESVKLNEKSFSDRLDVMKMFDAILIDNFDTSKLNKTQYSILKSWVQSGGLLIIGTGPSYSKTLSIFKDDFISGQFGSVKSISTNALYSFISKEGKAPLEISVLDMNIMNSRAYLKDGNSTLLHLIEKGSGNILLSSFDFGLKPVSDWDNSGTLGTKIISGFPGKGIINGKSIDTFYSLSNAARIIPDMATPGVKNFLIIFIVYAILVGPINYIILKKKDKREYMWLTVPILSLIFSGAMYVSGFGTRLNKPVANILSIIDVSRNGSMNSESYAGIFIPVKSNIKVEAGEDMDVKPVANMANDGYPMSQVPGGTASKVVDSKITTSAKTSIEFFRNSVWSMRMVGLEKQEPMQGNIECNLSYTNSSFTGVIKNETGLDFDQCYIITPDQYLEVGPLKDGESKDVKDVYKGYYNNQQGILRFMDPFAQGTAQYRNLSDEEARKLKRQQLDFQLANYYVMSGAYKNMGIKIMAFTSTPVSSDVFVNKKPVKKYERSLVTSDVKVSFNVGNKVEYPMGYISPISVSSTFRGFDPYWSRYFGRGSMEVEFKAEDNIIPEEITFKYSVGSKTGSASNYIKEYLWNYKTGTWEEGSYNYFTIDGDDLAKFVSLDGLVRIKIESDDESFNMGLPCISLKGSVK